MKRTMYGQYSCKTGVKYNEHKDRSDDDQSHLKEYDCTEDELIINKLLKEANYEMAA